MKWIPTQRLNLGKHSSILLGSVSLWGRAGYQDPGMGWGHSAYLNPPLCTKRAREEFYPLLSLRRDLFGREADRQEMTRRKGGSVMPWKGMKEGVMPLLRGWENVQSQGWGDRLVCVLADLVRVIPALPLTTG